MNYDDEEEVERKKKVVESKMTNERVWGMINIL